MRGNAGVIESELSTVLEGSFERSSKAGTIAGVTGSDDEASVFGVRAQGVNAGHGLEQLHRPSRQGGLPPLTGQGASGGTRQPPPLQRPSSASSRRAAAEALAEIERLQQLRSIDRQQQAAYASRHASQYAMQPEPANHQPSSSARRPGSASHESFNPMQSYAGSSHDGESVNSASWNDENADGDGLEAQLDAEIRRQEQLRGGGPDRFLDGDVGGSDYHTARGGEDCDWDGQGFATAADGLDDEDLPNT